MKMSFIKDRDYLIPTDSFILECEKKILKEAVEKGEMSVEQANDYMKKSEERALQKKKRLYHI